VHRGHEYYVGSPYPRTRHPRRSNVRRRLFIGGCARRGPAASCRYSAHARATGAHGCACRSHARAGATDGRANGTAHACADHRADTHPSSADSRAATQTTTG